MLYSPVTDDVAHALAGLVDPTLDGYDEERAAAYWEDIAKGFELQDRYLGAILEVSVVISIPINRWLLRSM